MESLLFYLDSRCGLIEGDGMKKIAALVLAAALLISGASFVIGSSPMLLDDPSGASTMEDLDSLFRVGSSIMASEITETGDLPSEPYNVNLSPSGTAIQVTWNAPNNTGISPITEYRVFWDLIPGARTYSASAGTSLAYSITGLAEGTTYFVSVAALNAVGQGPFSSEVLGQTAARLGEPSAPMVVTVVSGPGFNQVSWSASTDTGGIPLTGYLVYRSDTPGGEVLLADTGLNLSYNDTSVVNGQTYYYIVKASNGIYEGASSNEVQGTPHTTPSVPEQIQAAPGLKNITVSWVAPYDGGSTIDGYLLEYGTSVDDLSHSALTGNVTEYTLSGLFDGTFYSFKISAHNSAGFGQPSTIFQERTFGPPAAPIVAVASGLSFVNITWSVPPSDAPITGYKIFRGTISGALEAYATVNDTSFFNDTMVTSGQDHFYAVAALSDAGEGAMSDEIIAHPTSLPAVITDLLGQAGPMSVTLSWTPPADGGSAITAYNVYRGTEAGSLVRLTTVTGVTYKDTSAVPGTAYVYAVSAVNANGEGERSTVMATSLYPPPMPTDVRVMRNGDSAVITWSMPEGNSSSGEVGGFVIYRAVAGGHEETIGLITDSGARSFTDNDAPTGSSSYRVGVLNMDSSISPSVSGSVVLEGTESGLNVILILLPMGLGGAFLLIFLLRRKHNMV